MWVVKIGGSLNADALLPQWLEMLTQLGGGRVCIVCGGGEFADTVRRSQAHWRFDDLAAHNMAILAMVQGAYMLRALCPELRMAHDDADIVQVLHQGLAAVWAPAGLLREQVDADTNWGVTSDSIALGLARRLNAERLVLVKSCSVQPTTSLAELGESGVLDGGFAGAAAHAPFPIEIVSRDEGPRVRGLLLSGSGPVPAAPVLQRWS
jgi:aspartokinase-like uncharacterized kinase